MNRRTTSAREEPVKMGREGERHRPHRQRGGVTPGVQEATWLRSNCPNSLDPSSALEGLFLPASQMVCIWPPPFHRQFSSVLKTMLGAGLKTCHHPWALTAGMAGVVCRTTAMMLCALKCDSCVGCWKSHPRRRMGRAPLLALLLSFSKSTPGCSSVKCPS